MKTVGIICEYNPFHLGHQKQFGRIRSHFGADTAIVCLMSGNFVQRGAPAIFDKSLRARAAVDCGADLVLELPTEYALSSAEGFAAGGVKILSGFCDFLCFGTESGTAHSLMATAQALLRPDFSEALKSQLALGLSFPAARQAALAQLGTDASLLAQPNDLLAVEYCKAILSQRSPMQPWPISRPGSYHALEPDRENPSATALRQRILEGRTLLPYVPEYACAAFEAAPVHTLSAGEQAILARLRTMTEADFQALPYGSEGLWRKLMHACRRERTLEDIIAATKSKRYTRTRLDRMVLCAYLGIRAEDLAASIPYTRVLALGAQGPAVLKSARTHAAFLHTGEKADHPYWEREQRRNDLFGLFSVNGPTPAGQEPKRRLYIKK